MTTARTATPSTARAINDRIALELLAERGPLTAAQLKEATGLSRPSVADLLERLVRSGLVTVVGESGADRRGPNARLYDLLADRAHVAALDVRTRSVTVALADLTGRTVARAALPVTADPGPDGSGVVTAAVGTLDRVLQDSGVTALHTVVMGVPGLVDPATGALRRVSALPAWHGELVDALRGRPGGRVLLENEVNLAGIAEHRLGAARDRDAFVLLWLGHGVGAAVVLDGVLRRGASGGTGEIGFLPVPGTGGLPSATGCDGGFHALAGDTAIRALAREHGLAVPATAEELVRAATGAGATGRHREFLQTLAGRIAVAGAAVTSVLDPGCLVLGGEVGRAGGTVLAAAVEGRLGALSPLRTEVRPATVEGSPVLSGALVTALDAARTELFTADAAQRP
ncbi:ROK family transcriptional regulator [Streptomyces sp. ACA25]|uniref:ROK family transcriptional regulator n=1 Tax=Streptomyces sp. ACA25 TaxID=3022596 RepID=UPI002307F0C4|nr:ROK family transcriptional regulator [Streptomyces sp. ACA25]MDB1088885.1 ROK family transcriptional regulator [Streptomyces sp. ACA25]